MKLKRINTTGLYDIKIRAPANTVTTDGETVIPHDAYEVAYHMFGETYEEAKAERAHQAWADTGYNLNCSKGGR